MDVPCEMLLHPELLSNDQLRHIIQQRQLRIPNLDIMLRDQLLEVFHNYCVPYGQRKYRDSGRGKMLNKSRHLSPEVKPKLNVINTNQNRKIPSPPWTHDRIKPPPDLLSGHMKRIKLENNVLAISKDINYFKRKMSIDSMTPATDSPPPKKEKILITWP